MACDVTWLTWPTVEMLIASKKRYPDPWLRITCHNEMSIESYSFYPIYLSWKPGCILPGGAAIPHQGLCSGAWVTIFTTASHDIRLVIINSQFSHDDDENKILQLTRSSSELVKRPQAWCHRSARRLGSDWDLPFIWYFVTLLLALPV